MAVHDRYRIDDVKTSSTVESIQRHEEWRLLAPNSGLTRGGSGSMVRNDVSSEVEVSPGNEWRTPV